MKTNAGQRGAFAPFRGLERAGDACLLADLRGAILAVNGGACRVLGYSREELLALRLGDVANLPSDALAERGYEKGRLEDSATRAVSLFPRDGTTRPGHATLTWFEDEGRPLLFALIVPEPAAPPAPGEAVALSQGILDAFPGVALVFRPSTGEVVALNRAARRPGACPGGETTAVGRPDAHPWFLRPSVWTTGGTEHRELETAGRVWGLHWVSLAPDLFVHYANDLTGPRQMERQLAQAQKMEAIGTLAGGIAHDFGNMLQVILGASECVLGTTEAESAPHRWCKVIEAAAERARDLTRQFLAFGRQQVLQPRPVNLNQLVQGLEVMVRRLLEEDIALELLLDPHLAATTADPGQIEQVIMNLVANARDAMPAGGTIRIRTANAELGREHAERYAYVKPGAYVRLAVEDSGEGMSQETLAHLFEPFYTTKVAGAGTGLGLATSYGTVKQSGGYIWALSEPGKGSAIEVYLPRSDEAEAAACGAPAAAGPAGPPGARVLLAEDNEQVREAVRRMLEWMGYVVLEAAGAEAALRLGESTEEPLHLLLTDVVMPGMSGRALAERLSKVHPRLRVLYMSGHTDETIARHGILEPGLAFLQKPFGREQLRRKVEEVLGAPVLPRASSPC